MTAKNTKTRKPKPTYPRAQIKKHLSPVEMIPIGDVMLNRRVASLRKIRNEAEYVRDLTADIRTHGLRVPLIGSRDAQGKVEIISGDCRLKALRRLGASVVPVRLLSVREDRSEKIRKLTANMEWIAARLLRSEGTKGRRVLWRQAAASRGAA